MRVPGESDLKRYERRLKSLKSERYSWESHWKELADYYLPRRGRFLHQDVNKGDKRNTTIVNNVPVMAGRTLASGMMAGLTSPARPWFRLVTPDPDLMEFGPVKDWLWLVESRMRDVFARGNLYNALPTVYRELGVFCTANMIGMGDPRETVRWFPTTVGSYYIGVNDRLEVDTLYHEISMTVRQIVAKFGLARCSSTVRRMWDNGNYEQWVKLIHLIEPNSDRDPNYVDRLNKPWRSVWFEVGNHEEQTLLTSGFDAKPFMSPRWDVINEDIYGGAGPGMDSLGDAKALQIQERRKAQAIDKHVNPPLVAPTSMRNSRASLLPGDITYVDVAQGMQGFLPVYQVKPELRELREDMMAIEERINRSFYADLFLMLAMSDRRQMTATEVAERHEEKLLMLGPVLERLNDELLDPIIDLTFGLMEEDGRIPTPPDELLRDGGEIKVEYISILAQAQRMVGLNSVDRLWAFAAGIEQVQPGATDKLDAHQSIDEYAEMLGVPPGVVRSDEEVEEIQAAKAQAMQAAAANEQAATAANTAKALSETPVNNDSLLAAAMQAPPGQNPRGVLP